MTVNTQPPVAVYIEDGVTTIHAINFDFDTSADIAVVRVADDGEETYLELGTDYTVAGGAGTTGSITKLLTVPEDGRLEIRRIVSENIDQLVDYSQEAYDPDEHEHQLDKMTMAIQELAHKLARAILVKAGQSGEILPPLGDHPGELLRVNDDGDGLMFEDLFDMLDGALEPAFTFSVTSLPYGSPATITVTGTWPTYNLELGIPAGQPGVTSGADWGSIGGLLADQADLVTALNLKQGAHIFLEALTLLADDWSSGVAVVCMTADNVPALRQVGAASGTDLLDRDAADARYLQQSATLYHELYIPASALIPNTTSGAGPAATAETATNDLMLGYLPFDGAAIESAQIPVRMPKNWNEGAIVVQFDYYPASGSGTVRWGAKAVGLSDGEALDAARGTAQVVEDACTAGNFHRTAFTPAITVADAEEKDTIILEVYREGNHANDTLNGIDAHLLGISIGFTTNAKDES